MGASIWSSTGTISVANKYIQEFTATAGQVLFTLTTFSYTLGAFAVNVYINGILQSSSAFAQTSTTSITLSSGCSVGDIVTVTAIVV